MKKGLVFCFVVFSMILFSLNFVLGEVRINEVMPHDNNSWKDEWIEIYNDENFEINLTNWIIGDSNRNGDKKINLTIPAKEFALVVDKDISLDGQSGCNAFNIANKSCFELSTIGYYKLENDNENIFLYDNNSLIISNFSWTTSINSLGKSWGYDGSVWINCTPTPGQQNNCAQASPLICTSSYSCGSWTTCSNSNQTRICTNTTANCTTATHNITENQICSINFTQNTTTNTNLSIQLNWTNEEIINFDNFSIEVKAFNLLNYSYDIKIWLEFKDNDTIISDRYDENEEIWKSGTYFVEGFFSGGGNKTKDINLCLREDYTNFSGEAKIFVKLRKDNAIIVEVNYTINILPKTETSNNNSLLTTTIITNNTNNFTDTSNQNEIIRLGSKVNKETTETEDIKTEKNTIYKSKNEYIKEYAIYGFAILCVFLIILLLIDKK